MTIRKIDVFELFEGLTEMQFYTLNNSPEFRDAMNSGYIGRIYDTACMLLLPGDRSK
jgi:hypothetical protein